MNVWEETWEPASEGIQLDGRWIAGFCDNDEETDDLEVARARLAAAAPEMARLLIGAEWEGAGSGGEPAQCPWCGRENVYYDEKLNPERHEKGCSWVAVLRKAGVLT